MPIQSLLHPRLGPLTWDQRLRAYHGQVAGPAGSAIKVSVFPARNLRPGAPLPAEFPHLDELLDGAADLIGVVLERLDDVKQCVVECLLDVYNENWRNDDSAGEDELESDAEGAESTDDEELDQDSFKSRLALGSVHIFTDLSGEAWLLDGELFAGHDICVDIERGGQPTRARLHG